VTETTSDEQPVFGNQPPGISVNSAKESEPIRMEKTEPSEIVANKRSGARVIVLIAVVIVGLLGYFFIARGQTSASDLEKMQGKVALSEQQLQDVVVKNHLTVYWAGPLAGAKYSLIATNPATIYLKYLPGGVGINDNATPFRTVGTYIQKNAYQVAVYTGSVAGNVGMINGDGNALFYFSARDTNVYVGVKGHDTQIEIYDPVQGQALGLVLTKNLIRKIV